MNKSMCSIVKKEKKNRGCRGITLHSVSLAIKRQIHGEEWDESLPKQKKQEMQRCPEEKRACNVKEPKRSQCGWSVGWEAKSHIRGSYWDKHYLSPTLPLFAPDSILILLGIIIDYLGWEWPYDIALVNEMRPNSLLKSISLWNEK